jgi:hypothetical protein
MYGSFSNTLAARTAERDFCCAKTVLVSAEIVLFIGPYIARQIP